MSVPERYSNLTASEWAEQKFGILMPEDIKDNRPTVYIDMDGTLAVWNNKSLKNPNEAMTLDEIMERGYFRNLEPIAEMVEKARFLKEDCGFNVAILSKAYFHAIEEKTEWIKENMPFIDTEHEVFFVPCENIEAKKGNFIPSLGLRDVLIDDYNVNLDEWYGTAIKIITDKNTVRDDLPCFDYNCTNEEFLAVIEMAIEDRVKDFNALYTAEELLDMDEELDEAYEDIMSDLQNQKEQAFEKDYTKEMQSFGKSDVKEKVANKTNITKGE